MYHPDLSRETVEQRLGEHRVQPALAVGLEEVVPRAEPARRQPRLKKRAHLTARAEPVPDRDVPALLERAHQPPRPVEQQELSLVVGVAAWRRPPVGCGQPRL